MLVATYAKQTGRVVAYSMAAFRQAFAAGRDLGERDWVLVAAAAAEMHPAAVIKSAELRGTRAAAGGGDRGGPRGGRRRRARGPRRRRRCSTATASWRRPPARWGAGMKANREYELIVRRGGRGPAALADPDRVDQVEIVEIATGEVALFWDTAAGPDGPALARAQDRPGAARGDRTSSAAGGAGSPAKGTSAGAEERRGETHIPSPRHRQRRTPLSSRAAATCVPGRRLSHQPAPPPHLLKNAQAGPITPDMLRAALLVDLDRFGDVNAALGRDAGDGLLRRVRAATTRRRATAGRDRALRRRQLRSCSATASPDPWDALRARAPARRRLGRTVPRRRRGGLRHGLDRHRRRGRGRRAAARGRRRAAPREGVRPRRASSSTTTCCAPARSSGCASSATSATRSPSGELTVAFQPILDLRDGRPRAVEALARWTHPRRGAVSPAVFIPLAERCGLIAELGRAVLHDACQTVAALAPRAARRGGPVGVGQRLGAPDRRRRAAGRRARGAALCRPAAPRPGARSDRERADGGDRRPRPGARAPAQPRRADPARRLRHRLLVARLPAPLPRRRHQARPRVRRRRRAP